MTNKKILFRTDAASNIGIGHLMRSIALAQYLQSKGYDIKFLTNTDEKSLLELLKNYGFSFSLLSVPQEELGKERDLSFARELIKAFTPSWVVLDNYYFGYDYQKAIKNTGVGLMCIDDIAQNHFCSDIILNHGVHAGLLNYSSQEYTTKLLGTEYALLREEFLKDAPGEKPVNYDIKNILVTLGGGSHEQILVKIIKALSRIKNISARIIVNKNKQAGLNNLASGNIRIFDINYTMNEHYKWADMAIAAAGGTCWELCYYGISGIVGVVSDNQQLIAQELHKKGIFNSVGWYKDKSEEDISAALNNFISSKTRILEMKKAARTAVDGRGCERVSEIMSKFIRPAKVSSFALRASDGKPADAT